LRGHEFEDYLLDVFIGLGYKAEKTKKSRDQGVDIILCSGRRRWAIQAKGYGGNVGNAAVQQAHTGMLVWNCTHCAVITNSAFTRDARMNADVVRCRLIDGRELPALANGKLRV
jgi:restriction system protein